MKTKLCFILIVTIAFSCRTAQPPIETGDFKTSDLVELIKLNSTLHLDIKYTTAANLTGKQVYKEP